LPEYRICRAAAKGLLSGPFGATVNNLPVPVALLDKEHQSFATTVELREQIGFYEEMMRSDSSSFKIEWPADLVLYYQDRIVTQNGCHLAHAWQPISRGTIAQLFESVRNRTLATALEIRSSLKGTDLELNEVSSQTAAKIERTVTNNIYGGVNVIASGHSSVSSSVTQAHNRIPPANKEQLSAAIVAAGLPESSAYELEKAIQQDGGTTIGSRVNAWINENAPKVLVGGVKIATSVAQAVLTDYLKQYFGHQI